MSVMCKIFGHSGKIEPRSLEHSLVWTICRRYGSKLEEGSSTE